MDIKNSVSRQWRAFPELKTMEILQIMEELQIPFSENDLARPVPQHIQRVYEMFLHLFMGKSYRENDGMDLSVTDDLEYPEIHLDAVSLVIFFKKVSKLMTSVGIDDFSLKDIIKPETSRIRIILSGIINFAKFREEQLDVLEEFSSSLEKSNNDRKQLDNKRIHLEEVCSSIEDKKNKNLADIQVLESQVNGFISEIKEFKGGLDVINMELEDLKTKEEKNNDEISSQKYKIITLKNDTDSLKERVVCNPEVLTEEIQSLKNSINDEKTTLHSNEDIHRSLVRSHQLLLEIHQEVSRSVEHFRECLATIENKKELENDMSEKKDFIATMEQRIQNLRLVNENLVRQFTLQKEKIDNLNKQQNSKREILEKSLKSLKLEYARFSDEQVEVRKKISVNDDLIKKMESKITNLKRTHEIELNNLYNSFQHLKQQVKIGYIDIERVLV